MASWLGRQESQRLMTLRLPLPVRQFFGTDSNLSSFRILELQVRVKKSSKSVVQTQWKSKTVSSKRSGTIMFKDHVRVLGVKKGTVSMKAFTVPLQKAPKLNRKVGDSHTAFYFF